MRKDNMTTAQYRAILSPMYSRHTLVITWRNLARDFHPDVSEWSMDDLRERILELKRTGARIPSGT